jgi:hypothetical protein
MKTLAIQHRMGYRQLAAALVIALIEHNYTAEVELDELETI